MQDITRHHGQQAATGPIVWILESGEMHEGGSILGVHLERDLARGRFITEADTLGRRFDIDQVDQQMDGGITVEAGCDWLTLTPYPVTTHAEITDHNA